MRLAMAEWQELDDLREECDKLNAESAIIDRLISASDRKTSDALELKDFLWAAAQQRDDGREEEVLWISFDALRVYLVQGLLDQHTDASRSSAWERMSSLSARYR